MAELPSAADRNFNTYILGDNVYDLAANLIPDLAERVDIVLQDKPTSEALSRLVGALGPKPVLRDSNEPTITLEEAAQLVEESGVQEQLARSLWTPEFEIPKQVDGIVITGGMANWQDRAANLLVSHAAGRHNPGKVYIPVGNRVMNTGTEVTNSNVSDFHHLYGRYPEESAYVEDYILPKLATVGYEVHPIPYSTAAGETIADRFTSSHSELFNNDSEVIFARVANAGIHLAVQMRQAARFQNPDFDSQPNKPQVFVLTDTFPTARTEEQKSEPKNYQSPYTALRQVALTAKLLHETADGE